MSRKDESLLNLLVRLPWWVSVVSAVAIYLVFRFAVPAIPTEDPIVKRFAQGIGIFAPYPAVLLLVTGVVSAFLARRKTRLLKMQTGRESVRRLSWQQFETLVGEIFRKRGYRVLENPDDGPDGGVDLRLWKDGKKVYVQCKHWKNRNVGVKTVRELYGVMTAKKADEGIVVSSGGFTREAREFARKKPLSLIDGRELEKFLNEGEKLHKIERNFSPSRSEKKTCPKCGSRMVLRQARKGTYAGQSFWACSRYPHCRGILPYVSEDKARAD